MMNRKTVLAWMLPPLCLAGSVVLADSRNGLNVKDLGASGSKFGSVFAR